MSLAKSDIWMPVYIGDLLGDTQHLTNEQFGIYHKVLYHQWRHGHFSEADLEVIARYSTAISGAASSTLQAELRHTVSRVLTPIKKLLSVDPGGLLFSPRCDLEKEKWTEKKKVFIERARKGGFGKAKRVREERAKSGAASSMLQGMLESCTSPVEEQKQKQPPPTPSAPRRGIASKTPSASSTPVAARAAAAAPARATAARSAPPAKSRKRKESETGNSAPVRPSLELVGGVALKKSNGHGAAPPNLIATHAVNGSDHAKTDPRLAAFKGEVLEYWKGQNPEAPRYRWDAADERALSVLLIRSPDLQLAGFKKLLRNRAHSAVNPSALPHKWLRNLMEYASGSLGKFGRPAESRSL